jgi:selenocysteine-specific elongation factor
LAEDRELVLGTAGHIDHGKTALVEALTGTNTDRLEEERRRGISIELGFARLELPGGRAVGVIDVPGHRRLVRAMVAGAGGIDMYLLVIAADDGVMPQTHEHWTALSALGVTDGVVALTKADIASPEAMEIAREEAEALAPGAPLVEVSSRTGEGLERLAEAIEEVAGRLAGKGRWTWPPRGPVLHLDRVFSLKGIGTVVTGTLRGAPLAVGERVRLLPSERVVRIRSAQVHDVPVEVAPPGTRVAVNLVGVDRDEVRRGDVLTGVDGGPRPSYRLDAALDFDPDGGARRVQVHHGTRQTAARIVPLGSARLAQLRLEAPLIAEPGERLVIRRIAPPDTLGGGVVVDPSPARHGPGPASAALEEALAGEPEEILAAAIAATAGGLPRAPAGWVEVPLLGFALGRFPPERWEAARDALLEAGAVAISGERLIPAAAPREPVAAPVPLDATAVRVLRELDAGGLQPGGPAALAESLGLSRPDVEGALAALAAAGHVVTLRGEVSYPRERLERIGELVAELARERGSISLAELRDALRISRRYSQAILEHLDASGVTVRHGERHVLRRPLER